MPPSSAPRLLVFNCHEAWVHQLRLLGFPFDVVIQLRGRRVSGWDAAMRPAPNEARFVKLDQALENHRLRPYGCIITHNLTDLLDTKSFHAPRLFVIHSTLDHLLIEQNSRTPRDAILSTTSRYLAFLRAYPIAVSALKARSWQIDAKVVAFCADPRDYLLPTHETAAGLRITNDICRKRRTLAWDFHQATFAHLPVTLVGRNEEMPGVYPARDWNHLKGMLSRHRFFIHTADLQLEDGYNMAMLEAMAAGLPVLGNCHPTSPIEHGKSGFLSNDPAELRRYAERLLADRQLAARMGAEAKRIVTEKFPPEKFKAGMLVAIAEAQRRWTRSASVSA